MVNPFEALDLRLSNIEQLLLYIQGKIGEQPIVTDGAINGRVEFDKACQITGLSPDRLYAIHHRFFNTSKPGKKLLFLVEELYSYREGTLQPKANKVLDNLA